MLLGKQESFPTKCSLSSLTINSDHFLVVFLLRGPISHTAEDGAKLFPVVPSSRTRGNGHKLKPRKLQLNPRKNFFPLRVTEPWPRLPREVVESPSLEIFQTLLDEVLCSLLWVTLLRQGVGLDDPQRSLPTPTIL